MTSNNNRIEHSPKPRILIGATGSVDITLLPKILTTIKANIDCFLTVLMTPSALSFLPAETLERIFPVMEAGLSFRDAF